MTEPNAWSAMSDVLPAFLASGAVKGTVVVILAWGIAWLWRRRAAVDRHLLWSLALASFLVLPLLGHSDWRWGPAAVVPMPSDPVVGPHVPLEPMPTDDSPGTMLRHPVETLSEGAFNGLPAGEARDRPAPGNASTPPASGGSSIWWWVWTAGFLGLGGRLVIGRVVLWRVSDADAPLALQKRLDRLAVQLGIRRRIKLVTCRRRLMPMTWGIWSPRILLPLEAESWEPHRVDTVLLHELAHVKRKDGAMQWLVHLVTACFWFHPLVWWTARRLEIERERACDDLVLGEGVKASLYAQQLVELASGGRALEDPCRLGAVGIAMARPTLLETRVRRLLDPSLVRQSMGRAGMRGVVAVWCGVIVSLGTLRSQEVAADAVAEVAPSAAAIEPIANEESGAGDTRGAVGGQEGVGESADASEVLQGEGPADGIKAGDRLEPWNLTRALREQQAKEREENDRALGSRTEALEAEARRLEALLKELEGGSSGEVPSTEATLAGLSQKIHSLAEQVEHLRGRARGGDWVDRLFPPERVVENARSRYLAALAELQVMEERYGNRHPKMLQQRALVQELRERLEKSRALVQVATPQPGIVTRICVKEGETVKRGAVLVELDARRAELALQTARSDAELAQVRLETADRLREQAQAQVKAGATTVVELGDLELARQEARAGLMKALAEVERAEFDLQDLFIRAPANGRVLSLEVHEGEYVAPGNPVVRLQVEDR